MATCAPPVGQRAPALLAGADSQSAGPHL